MYLRTQTKNGTSVLVLSRQLEMRYKTDWKTKHKLMQMEKEHENTHPLGGWVQLHDTYCDGERRSGKRRRGAPVKSPVVAAVEFNRGAIPVRMRLSWVGAFASEELATWAKRHRKPRTVVLSHTLGCFGAKSRGVDSSEIHNRTWPYERSACGADLGQDDPGQYQALAAWQVSLRQHQASATIPRRVLLSVQPLFLAAGEVSSARIRRSAHSAHTLSTTQDGRT